MLTLLFTKVVHRNLVGSSLYTTLGLGGPATARMPFAMCAGAGYGIRGPEPRYREAKALETHAESPIPTEEESIETKLTKALSGEKNECGDEEKDDKGCYLLK
jgi:hypothetical protein